MTFFTKKSKKRNRITRKKKRNSRKKNSPPRYKKIRGGGQLETMSKSIVESFPIMEKFPSCGRCMAAIDNSVNEKENAMKTNMNTKLHLKAEDEEDWNGWTGKELDELCVRRSPSSNSTPLNNLPVKPNASPKKRINPYSRKATQKVLNYGKE